jgi:hypothetical protein
MFRELLRGHGTLDVPVPVRGDGVFFFHGIWVWISETTRPDPARQKKRNGRSVAFVAR